MVGLLTRVWQSRIWITPLPSRLRQNQSAIFRAGSLKNNSPPSLSSAMMDLVMAPRLGLVILPYFKVNSLAFSPTYWIMAFRSLVSIRSSPSSSAILNIIVNISLCVSFNSRIRDNSKGPISEMVVRSGSPFSPYTSQ